MYKMMWVMIRGWVGFFCICLVLWFCSRKIMMFIRISSFEMVCGKKFGFIVMMLFVL